MKILLLFSFLFSSACSSPNETAKDENNVSYQQSELDTATLAGGCFWCVEAAIEQIIGVQEVVSGYSGGAKETANYKAVSSGKTEHAEAVQVYFNPSVLSYEKLLDIFFTAHDPTQPNRQGPDYGPQYRTAIFYHSESQKNIAEAKIKELDPNYNSPIVTELNEFEAFYLAEEYHQDYQKKNPFQPYIMSVSKPKYEKVRKKYPELLKKDS
jgi:peptide-methionine (S)-S-oxide reductase